ncbi:hypothetical protein RO3G_09343 [Rhizopus delemar RA 99-880]|uniref:Uncharacterized protein n=1 Tax=Rhizopus delemar (strain RA 99-880 / ATCC MYA-4621 / FGSC 9543 / NRRL 43880) TaxID=246409 RepID=I1C853_RHIO9|nr:hypothetical protein RO3G_09343 [Rhizopus delemar RA 99-880]|eukprot:EIE84633.1 hypothetical protein RO3G_09343 [Rhizopus delemar RA 99-880]
MDSTNGIIFGLSCLKLTCHPTPLLVSQSIRRVNRAGMLPYHVDSDPVQTLCQFIPLSYA